MQKLNHWLLAAAVLIASYAPAGQPPGKLHQACEGETCRIEAPLSRIHKQFEKSKFVTTDCPHGISPTAIPRAFETIGNKKRTAILPIIENPESFLEAGDILLYTKEPMQVVGWETLLEGLGHAALVIDREGRKYHMDSPSWLSSDDFDSEPFHILRLTHYPPEVHNPAKLEKWQQDPTLKAKLEDWSKTRETSLRTILENANTLLKYIHRYDAEFKPGFTQEADFKPWRENFALQCAKGVPDLYCTKLLQFLSGTAPGLPLMQPRSLLRSVEQMEQTDIPLVMAKTKLSREAVIKQELDALFTNHPSLTVMPQEQRDRMRMTLEAFFLMSPTERNLLFSVLPADAQARFPVAPADYLNSIYDERGIYAYVGTFVGPKCQIANGIKPGAGKKVPESLLKAIQKYEGEMSALLKDLEEIQLAQGKRNPALESLQKEMIELREKYFQDRGRLEQKLKSSSRTASWDSMDASRSEWAKLGAVYLKRLQDLQKRTEILAKESVEARRGAGTVIR